MIDNSLKLVSKIQHFFDYMHQRKQDLEEEILVHNQEVVKHLNEAYDDFIEEYLDLFKEIIYQK